ncbi:MAG TPA: penicillin-binding protein activator LpoB [Candidatus Deferrimicrobium sp.]|nr:penicillin-binding protein activator LpoB [Candidatus Deferrimicrobium sp.]
MRNGSLMRHLLTFLTAVALLSCGGGKQVTRLDTETTTDLSGQWNDTDSRLVAEEMISDCLSRPWLTDAIAAKGSKPVVTVGTIKNLTSEHIAMETFLSDFERELINSDRVRFVASRGQRSEVREERWEQAEFASKETAKRLREELGADFLVQGAIKTITDQEGSNKVVFYQTDLELINIESMEKVWVGTQKIKKGISQGSRKW